MLLILSGWCTLPLTKPGGDKTFAKLEMFKENDIQRTFPFVQRVLFALELESGNGEGWKTKEVGADEEKKNDLWKSIYHYHKDKWKVLHHPPPSTFMNPGPPENVCADEKNWTENTVLWPHLHRPRAVIRIIPHLAYYPNSNSINVNLLIPLRLLPQPKNLPTQSHHDSLMATTRKTGIIRYPTQYAAGSLQFNYRRVIPS